MRQSKNSLNHNWVKFYFSGDVFLSAFLAVVINKSSCGRTLPCALTTNNFRGNRCRNSRVSSFSVPRSRESWEQGWKISSVPVTSCMITMKAKLTTLEISVIKEQVVTSFSRELSWAIGSNKGVHFLVLFVQVLKDVLGLKLKLKSKLVNFYFIPVN